MPTPLPLPLTEVAVPGPFDYDLLDTPAEELFDAFARLAARLCDAPVALVGVVDPDGRWFTAMTGLETTETSPEAAFCARTLAHAGVFEIPDARADPRVADNPLVAGKAGLRAYAGVALRAPHGDAVGALAVADRKPRVFTPEQHAALCATAEAIVEQFEARRALLRLFDDAHAELYRVDLVSKRIVFASAAARRNLGYAMHELRGVPLGEILPTLAREGRIASRLEELRNTPDRRLTLRTRARRKDGTTYPIELRIERREARGGDTAMVFAVDLSEREEAQQRISLLSAAIEESQEPTVIAKLGASPHEPGTLVYANDAYVRQKGATQDDVLGRPDDLFLGPETDRAQIAFLRGELLAGRSAKVEYVSYRADGSTYVSESAARPLIDETGRATHYVVVQRDITDQVLRGAQLTMQNERLTAITSIAQKLFAMLESSLLVEALLAGVDELFGGEATLYEPAARGGFVALSELHGGEPADAIDDPFISAAAQSEVCVVEPGEQRAAIRIAGSGGGTAFVLDVRRKSGFGTADVFALGLLGQYFAVAARNVELYEELSARRDAVVELNQVKNDLIAMLAHDFKGPLTTIVGFADVLADDERFDRESRQYLEMISSSAMRLASLATDTLALSRLEQNELALVIGEVDLVALVRDVVRVFSVTRPIDLRASAGTLTVAGDESRLRQVVENLIGNAIKYSPGGEPVEVALRSRPRGVELAVRDRGIGIPEHELGKLFGRFARASNARALGIGGTGFGLYLCRTIVELHGGTITVDSVENEGSTFRVLVPIRAAQQAAVRRVVLLDVDGDARSYVAHALRDDGFAVTVAQSGEDVLRILGEGVYQAALIDADRLEMAPEAFVARVAGRTALVRMGLRLATETTGWDAVVAKPFLMKDLYTAISEALGQAAGGLATAPAGAAAPR